MTNVEMVFTKEDRKRMYELLKGERDGVPVAGHQAKLLEALERRKITITKALLAQRLFWATNDQPLWQCVYALLEVERPWSAKESF